MSWATAKFSTLVLEAKHAIVGGPFGSKLTTRDYVDDGVPVIRGANMNNGRYLLEDNFVFVTEEKKKKDLQSNIARRGDLVFTQRGTLGQVAIIPEDAHHEEFVISQSQMKATVDPDRADKQFYYYYFSSKAVVDKIVSMTSSSGVPHINLGTLKDFDVPVPPIDTQGKIASILSAYDDLIENNRRRIALLEQAARLLYREWFVHFRFPGHETATFVDGLPEGWSETTLFDVVDVLSGGTPKTGTSAFWGGDIPFFTPKDTGDFAYVNDTEKTITEEGLKACNSRLYEKDTLFITARGTVGKLRLAQRPMAMNQSCYALASKSQLSQQYLYFAITERVNHLKGRAAGAVFDAIVVDTFKKIPINMPSEELSDEFSRFAKSTLSQIDRLSTLNRSLVAARDLLLPRLMDGRISVDV